MTPLPFDPATERYVSLATYRRNGAAVLTPVWLAQANECYYLFSDGTAGKVKRIRANPRARIAPCTASGKVTGPWLDVEARIITAPAVTAAAYTALRAKYGWQMAVLDFFSGLSGKKRQRAIIELAFPASTPIMVDLPQ